MYKTISDQVILRTADNTFFPRIEGSAEYNEFQKWEAAGGVIEAADEPMQSRVVPPTKAELQAQLTDIGAQIEALPDDAEVRQ